MPSLPGSRLQAEPDADMSLYAVAQAQYRAHHQALLDAVAQEEQARERAAKELTAARETERKLEKTLPSYERTAAAYEKLAGEKLVGQLQAEEQRRLVTEQAQDLAAQRATVASLEAAVNQSARRMAQLKSNYASDLHALRADTVEKIDAARAAERQAAVPPAEPGTQARRRPGP